jgi:glycosyltransferase involved in cell wall biosynthesis
MPDRQFPSQTSRPRVLAIAYACHPDKGSEEGVGWGWTRMLAQRHDVTVITAAFQRPGIEAALSQLGVEAHHPRFEYVPHRRWHYAPTPRWRRIENSSLKPLMNLAYAAWQRDAYRLARQLHARSRFDLVHLLTYVGFRFPGQFWKLDAPFVWGPIGGLENTSWRFLPMLGPHDGLYYAARNTINSLQKRLLPGPKRAFRKARGGIIAATSGIQREILRCYGQPSDVICEVGPPLDAQAAPAWREPGMPLRIVWSGQHLSGKALPLLLRALAGLPDELAWELDILGTGNCTESWRRLAGQLDIDHRCRWRGWLPRREAVEVMRAGHLFAITSIKDLTSSVLLEALSLGVPVICPRWCGFADVVTPDCGVTVAGETPTELIAGLAGAIVRLAGDEPLRRRLAAGALRRVEGFTWECKGQALESVYQRVLRGAA